LSASLTNKQRLSPTTTAILLALLAVFIWSGNFIVARGVYKEIGPVTLAFYRWLLASIILLPFGIRAFKKEWPAVRNAFAYFLLVSLTGVALFNTFVYIGAHDTTAINLALIGTTSSPVMAIILARIFLKEKIGWNKLAGLVICITGVLFLLSRGNFRNLVTFHFTAGDIWVLIAAFCFAVYNTSVKKKPSSISAINFLFVSFSLGTIMLFPFFLWETSNSKAIAWNGKLIFSIVYLGLGASVICFWLWNIAIRQLGAARTALFGNLIPVFSGLEAVLILNEPFTWVHVVSMIIVFSGILLANMGNGEMRKR
jgi:drug/metabolite transporter (DMT)-like permease